MTGRNRNPSERRLAALRRRLREAHLAAYLATSGVDVSYLSGFGGEDAWLLVPARGRATLLTDFRFAEDAEADCPHVRAVLRKGSMVDELRRVARRLEGPVGFSPEAATVAQRTGLARKLGARNIQAAPGLVAAMRIEKDAGEVAALRRALRVAERAYDEFLDRVAVGMTEIELAAELEYLMRRHGSEGPSFPTICAVGPNASRPHARPGRRRLAASSPLLVDFGATVAGYRCDLTRMVLPPRIRADFRAAYEAVLAAQAAAIAAAGPGARAVEVDAAARSVLAERGYGEAFGHGTGHGLGREVHEAPVLSPRAGDVTLRPGMVVTVEPGAYLAGRFGIRIEDDVLITGKGRSVLSRLPKQIDQVRRRT